MVQLIAVSLFCFLLLWQYQPLLEYKVPLGQNDTMKLGRFLKTIEGTTYDDVLWVNPEDDREWALGYFGE